MEQQPQMVDVRVRALGAATGMPAPHPVQHHMEETCAWLRCLSLNTSARAATLLAQRHGAAGGLGGGRAPRPPRLPAAERREVWRVVQVGGLVPGAVQWLDVASCEALASRRRRDLRVALRLHCLGVQQQAR